MWLPCGEGPRGVFANTLISRQASLKSWEGVIAAKRTFGRTILEKRKELGLSQKELAAHVHREDGTPISPQYLNDIEHDRRSPTGRHLIEQLAKVLKLESDYLSFLAGQFPDDIRRHIPDPEHFANAWQAFRRSLKEGGKR
jgi:transcriptional regulator with XRE-family HTH domain